MQKRIIIFFLYKPYTEKTPMLFDSDILLTNLLIVQLLFELVLFRLQVNGLLLLWVHLSWLDEKQWLFPFLWFRCKILCIQIHHVKRHRKVLLIQLLKAFGLQRRIIIILISFAGKKLRIYKSDRAGDSEIILQPSKTCDK